MLKFVKKGGGQSEATQGPVHKYMWIRLETNALRTQSLLTLLFCHGDNLLQRVIGPYTNIWRTQCELLFDWSIYSVIVFFVVGSSKIHERLPGMISYGVLLDIGVSSNNKVKKKNKHLILIRFTQNQRQILTCTLCILYFQNSAFQFAAICFAKQVIGKLKQAFSAKKSKNENENSYYDYCDHCDYCDYSQIQTELEPTSDSAGYGRRLKE